MSENDTEITEELIYEYWDCPQCGKKEIRGDIASCSACGLPRNDNIYFYRKATEEKVADEEAIKRFEAGPDWKCDYCASFNSALEAKCRACGNPRSDKQKDYFQVREKAEIKEQQRQENLAGKTKATKNFNPLKMVLIAVAFLLVGGLGYWFWATRTNAIDFTVDEVSWERSITVLKYQWSEKEDWEGELQGDDIQKLDQFRKIHHYVQKLVGYHTEWYNDVERVQEGSERKCSTSYRSTGSGASRKTTSCRSIPRYVNRNVRRSREVPDYRSLPIEKYRIRYKAKLYIPQQPTTLSGSDNTPRWPEVLLGTGLDNKPDKIDKKIEKYKVKFTKVNTEVNGPQVFVLSANVDNFEKKYLLHKKIPFLVNNRGKIILSDRNTSNASDNVNGNSSSTKEFIFDE